MSQIAITRSAEPLQIKGVYFHSFQELKKSLLIKSIEDDCLVSDLTMGAWRSHWVARELISQLDSKRLSPRLFPKINIYGNWKSGGDYGLMVGKLIDAESFGDKNTIQAHHFALHILLLLQNSKPKKILILGPKFNSDWNEENKMFINFLAQGLSNTQHEIYLVLHSEKDEVIHENWDVEMVNKPPLFSILTQRPFVIPGLVTNDCLGPLKKDEDYIKLSKGWALISPSLRKSHLYCFTEKAIRFKEHESESWAQDYITSFETKKEPDLHKIMEISSRHFSEGGFEVAFKHISRALEFCRDEIHQAILQVQAQGMRIALLKFQEAASQSVPESSTIPNNLLGSLYLSKAWGLVMLNKPNLAEVYFKKSRRILIHFKNTIYYLYLLNISALNKVKLKKVDLAFEIEKEIEERIKKLPKINWQLYYINSINQARLFKKIKSLKLSEKYYQKAFSTTLSLRSESDLIYTNLCTSQLEKLKGNYLLSFLYLYRSIVHWLSMEVPESIAPRIANAILNKPFYHKTDLPDVISKKLTEMFLEITKLAKLLSPEFDISKVDPSKYVVFNRLDIHRSINEENVVWVGSPGWAFVLGNSIKEPVFKSKNHNILSSLIYKYAEKAIPNNYIPQNPIILVDDQLGCEIPSTKAETIESAIRTGIKTVIYRRKKYELNEDLIDYLENNLKMIPAPGIDYLYQDENKKGIQFKRYKEKIDLNPFRQNLFSHINEEPTIEELTIKTNVRKIDLIKDLRAMEGKKQIRLELDPSLNLQKIFAELEREHEKIEK